MAKQPDQATEQDIAGVFTKVLSGSQKVDKTFSTVNT